MKKQFLVQCFDVDDNVVISAKFAPISDAFVFARDNIHRPCVYLLERETGELLFHAENGAVLWNIFSID